MGKTVDPNQNTQSQQVNNSNQPNIQNQNNAPVNNISQEVLNNAISLFESGRDFSKRTEINSPSALPQESKIPKEILLTGNTNDIVEYYIANESKLSDIELSYLMDRYANIKYINYVKDNRAKTPKTEQKLELQKDGSYILPNVTMSREQDSYNGCWSCAYELLLRSKGVDIDQKNIRGYRPDIKKEDVAEISDDSAIGFIQDRFYSIMESSDLALDVLPNTAMMGLNFNIGIDKSTYKMDTADALEAKNQLVNAVRDILINKKTPVSLNEGSHFYTIVGINPNGDFLCKDSLGEHRKTDPNYTYTYSPNKFIDKALSTAPNKGVDSISIQLNYIEDLDVQNGDITNFKGTDLEKFSYQDNKLVFDTELLKHDFFDNNSLNVNGQLFGTVKTVKEGFTISKTAYVPKTLVQMQPAVNLDAQNKKSEDKPELKPEEAKPSEIKTESIIDQTKSEVKEEKKEEPKVQEVKPEAKVEKIIEKTNNIPQKKEPVTINKVTKKPQPFKADYSPFESLAAQLEKAKTVYNSSEYNNLIKLTKLVGQNANIGGSEKLPAEQAHVYKMKMMKDLVDAYITHKGKDGVKSNAYGKLYVVEKLSKAIKESMKNVPDIVFEFNGKVFNPKQIKTGYTDYAKKFVRENSTVANQYQEKGLADYDNAFDNAKKHFTQLPYEAKEAIIDVDHCMGKIIMSSIKNGQSKETIDSLKAMRESFLEKPFPTVSQKNEKAISQKNVVKNELVL